MVTEAPSTPLPKLYDMYAGDAVEVLVRSISSALSEAVLLVDPSGEIVWHNPVALDVLAMASSDLLGRQLDDERWRAITLDGEPFPLSDFRSRLREPGAGIIGAPIGVRTGDARLIWLNAALTPVEVDEQRHTIVVLNDITDRISQRRRLSRTVDDLRRSLAPADLPESDVVRFAAGRCDSDDASALGADFFAVDVDGDATRFVVGDSSGSDARAVGLSVTALASMRAVGGLASDLGTATDRLDAVIDDDPRHRVTALAGWIETPYGIPTLSLVSAGHALPILIRDGRAVEIGSMSAMVGVTVPGGRCATRHELRSGDIVIAYTDGLTECVVPRLSADDLLDRIPVNVAVDAVIDTLIRMFDANPGSSHGAAVFGFQVR